MKNLSFVKNLILNEKVPAFFHVLNTVLNTVFPTNIFLQQDHKVSNDEHFCNLKFCSSLASCLKNKKNITTLHVVLSFFLRLYNYLYFNITSENFILYRIVTNYI